MFLLLPSFRRDIPVWHKIGTIKKDEDQFAFVPPLLSGHLISLVTRVDEAHTVHSLVTIATDLSGIRHANIIFLSPPWKIPCSFFMQNITCNEGHTMRPFQPKTFLLCPKWEGRNSCALRIQRGHRVSLLLCGLSYTEIICLWTRRMPESHKRRNSKKLATPVAGNNSSSPSSVSSLFAVMLSDYDSLKTARMSHRCVTIKAHLLSEVSLQLQRFGVVTITSGFFFTVVSVFLHCYNYLLYFLHL